MKKILIFLAVFPFCANADMFWTASSSPIVIDVPVTVDASSTLTIEAGTTVQFVPGLGSLTVNGSLVAVGTAQSPIVFTSGSTSPTIGDWQGIVFSAGSAGDIENSSVEFAKNGIFEIGPANLVLKDNNFSNNQNTALIEAGGDFVHSGNISSDLIRGFRYIGTTKDGEHINSSDLPVLITGGYLTIPNNTTFIIDPGAVIKLDLDGFIDVFGSLLVATGTQKTVFTSASENPAFRDWQGILFENGSSGDLSNVDFEYAGANAIGPFIHSTLYNLGGTLNLQSISTLNVPDTIIYQTSGTTTVTNSALASADTAIQVNGGNLTISNSKIYQNGSWGINNTSLNQIDARNNWWGSKDGPNAPTNASSTGQRISSNILFTPWIGRDPSLPNPVIIVPGIMGSTLVDASGNEVWMDLARLSLPGNDSFLDQLSLAADGSSSPTILTTTDIVRSINVPIFTRHIYDFLIQQLNSSGYSEGIDLFVFPYDWRLDIDTQALVLKRTIDIVRNTTGASKVNIISHSMGGLLIKSYLKNFNNDIDKFIDLSTPQLGAPSAYNTIEFGNTNISILNRSTAKKISQNMPSIYELLPSGNYFDASSTDYKYYVFNGENTNKLLSFDDTKQYLKDSGRNAQLVDRADQFHQGVDGLDPAAYGVKTYNFVGCGTPTIGQFLLLGKDSNGDTEYDIKMINGDGTVPLKSAEALLASETYFVKNGVHATLPSTNGVKDLIADILSGQGEANLFKYSNISKFESDCPKVNGTLVSFHSPVTLNAYDQAGNHDGPDANGDVEINIPGSDYEIIENNKFAFLPAGSNFTIAGQATGGGTADIRVETITDGEVTNTNLWDNVPLTSTTHIQFVVGQIVPVYIAIDKDGDGNFESTLDLSRAVAGFVDTVPPLPTSIVPVEVHRDVIISSGGRRIDKTEVPKIEKKTLPPAYKLAKPKINLPKSGMTATSTNNSSNTATAYKSNVHVFKRIFTSLWGWLRNKL